MKVYDRYAAVSLLSITVATLMLMILVLVMFDVFSQLDRYLSNSVPLTMILKLALLYVPETIGLAIGPAVLFSTTYFLAMLHANNEMIVLLNSGYSRIRMLLPLLATGIVLSCMLFIFTELVALDASRSKRLLSDEVFGVRSQSDNRNITLRSPDPSYVLHAGRYQDQNERITDVTLIVTDDDCRLSERVQASSGSYVEGHWVLYDAIVHSINLDDVQVSTSRIQQYDNEQIILEPGLFRNLGADIRTMELLSALQYIQRLKIISASQYPVVATELYARMLAALTPFILIMIACSSVFNWKKNVLVLSIIASLAIAIVYYVLQMVSMILAKQGVIQPLLGPLAPMILLLVVTPLLARAARK